LCPTSISIQETFTPIPIDDQQEQEQFEEPKVGESNLKEQNDIPINSTPGETESSTPTDNFRCLESF